ncbi:uncharacterized protein BCR38DRAFT_434905 [Pseudomassariella vexata]|uniref:Uncharacterized protein n=1 Tax=Pseudomassariella vexata TaxID=1141098 RepID=A0A1Y2DZ42_9PEZI|nr:uncharacterized protein BCR38DRAFT_434905 [Pseudomassariella vexata]ORY64364.1 hypothetical protein BCR38DRAFT_434905 [Pseudomassariella vexata]
MTWFTPERNILSFPLSTIRQPISYRCIFANAKEFLVDSLPLHSPWSLLEQIMPLSSTGSDYQGLNTIILSASPVIVNSTWDPQATQDIFGNDGVRVVDLLDEAAVVGMLKLLGRLQSRNFCPTEITAFREQLEFEASRCSLYWPDFKSCFMDAWLGAKRTMNSASFPQTVQTVTPDGEVVTVPKTSYRYQHGIPFDLMPPIDHKGRWGKASDMERQWLADMPKLRPVFTFILPDQVEKGRMWFHR